MSLWIQRGISPSSSTRPCHRSCSGLSSTTSSLLSTLTYRNVRLSASYGAGVWGMGEGSSSWERWTWGGRATLQGTLSFCGNVPGLLRSPYRSCRLSLAAVLACLSRRCSALPPAGSSST
jgi:hypothetical protein